MLLPAVTPERLERIAAGFSGAHVLVVGDAMLDKFIVGRVTRITRWPVVALTPKLSCKVRAERAI